MGVSFDRVGRHEEWPRLAQWALGWATLCTSTTFVSIEQFHAVNCAGGGNRTRTPLAGPRILSPVRLPVPPPRRMRISETQFLSQCNRFMYWSSGAGCLAAKD
jgi:hypothetical protein